MPCELTGFEKSILESWEDWDGDHECKMFLGATLAVDIGKYNAGEKVDCVTFLMEDSIVQVIEYDDGEYPDQKEIYRVEKKFKIVLE